MKNVDELRDELSNIFMRLKSGEVKHAEAAEFSNLAGKMISSAKVQVEYYAMLGAMRGDVKMPRIAFLESTNPAKEPRK